MIHLLFAPLLAFAYPSPTDFVPQLQLETDMKAYCLKSAVRAGAPDLKVLDATEKTTYGVQFQSVRFQQKLIRIDRPPDCTAEREIVQMVNGGKKTLLYDSKLYETAYCDQPVRYTHPPRVYEFFGLEDSERKQTRKLAVLELFSATGFCPDVEEIRTHRFQIFDLGAEAKLLLDVEAEALVPEHGEDTYRLHVIGAKSRANQRPTEIELVKGAFKIAFTGPPATMPILPPNPAQKAQPLNKVYRKDAKVVYYELVDEGGKIEGADPKTFELLSDDGESAYTRDAKSVFFFGKRLPKADPKTFVQLNSRYGKDTQRVYHMEKPFDGVDVPSFTAPYAQSAWHARDKDHVYYGTKIIEKADPASFSTGDDRSCGEGCQYRAEDKNYRFDWSGKIVQKAVAP